ncbi:hypothetical protein B8V81_3039 [Paenibacillus pasadenensis]|uniref:Uncharacterized protein n=1 Tax=Paenibacillus pasadenensis TaxID=217090 RepID=A0A2N5N2P3_9BACL|nr:hypothetical protein B8V81_3039 [Paenibacillus pasadenensis]
MTLEPSGLFIDGQDEQPSASTALDFPLSKGTFMTVPVTHHP